MQGVQKHILQKHILHITLSRLESTSQHVDPKRSPYKTKENIRHKRHVELSKTGPLATVKIQGERHVRYPSSSVPEDKRKDS